MIKLIKNQTSLSVDPEQGGRIASLKIDGNEILVTDRDSPLSWGCYPMAPWVGRLREGKLEFEGKHYGFELNMPPNAIHGTCLKKSWHVENQKEDRIHLSTRLEPEWPFSGKAEQEITLEANKLSCKLSVTSAKERFPASIGWHPWFRRDVFAQSGGQQDANELSLTFEAAKKFETDDLQIPTGKLIAPGQKPWDDCFTELQSNPVLRWGNRLELEISSSCDHWVAYTFPEHAICVEPQTGPANVINTEQAFIVEPGKPLEAEMVWTWNNLSK